MHIDYL